MSNGLIKKKFSKSQFVIIFISQNGAIKVTENVLSLLTQVEPSASLFLLIKLGGLYKFPIRGCCVATVLSCRKFIFGYISGAVELGWLGGIVVALWLNEV